MSSLIPKLSKFQWRLTCDACPVQFDICHNDDRIAYFRFRGGILSVNNYDGDEIGDNLIYLDEITYEGSYLSQEELDEIVPIVEQKIVEYLAL
jgi:hypothetical protein